MSSMIEFLVNTTFQSAGLFVGNSPPLVSTSVNLSLITEIEVVELDISKILLRLFVVFSGIGFWVSSRYFFVFYMWIVEKGFSLSSNGNIVLFRVGINLCKFTACFHHLRKLIWIPMLPQ